MSLSPSENPSRVARREDWGTAVEVEPGLFRLRLFNTRGALLINTYIYKSPGHLAVIDPGWPWTLDALAQALEDLGMGGLNDVDQWLYTHTHIDHMGLAAVLQDHSDGTHHAWSAVEPHLAEWHTYQDRSNDWSGWGSEAFAEPTRTLLMKAYKKRKEEGSGGMVLEFGSRSVENYELFELGDTIQVGDLNFEILDARGHDPYHIAFWEAEKGWLFVGDAVIATPTPISRAMNDDLTLYEQTLNRLSALDTKLLLPGHGVQKHKHIDAAFAKSKSYIDQYRAGILNTLGQAESSLDLYEIGLQLTPSKEPFTPLARWWVHLALADSHLLHLEKAGKVNLQEGPRYRLG